MTTVPKDAWKYEDPHPGDRGILLSDHIDELCDAGLLIGKGYDRKYLRRAAYTLTIGNEYIDSEGMHQRLTEERDTFVFKKNSIVYVSIAEELNLPYYVIARFNLRVKWVYDGILLGTGPQVDPGFRGRLSCPLYNLTNLDLTIKRGQEFATIDFEKTTTFLSGLDAAAKAEKLKVESASGQVETGGRLYKLFRQQPLIPLEHVHGHVIVSSLSEMRDEVKTWRNIGIGLVISFVALTVALLNWGNNLSRQALDNAKQIEQSVAKTEALKDRVERTEKAITSRGIDAAEKQNTPPASPQKPNQGKANP